MDVSLVIALLTALGAGGAVGTVVVRILDRKKTAADVTAVLSQASGALVASYQKANESLRDELDQAREEIKQLRAEVGSVETKLDQVLDVVSDERRWARQQGHQDAPVLKIINNHQ